MASVITVALATGGFIAIAIATCGIFVIAIVIRSIIAIAHSESWYHRDRYCNLRFHHNHSQQIAVSLRLLAANRSIIAIARSKSWYHCNHYCNSRYHRDHSEGVAVPARPLSQITGLEGQVEETSSKTAGSDRLYRLL